MEVNSKGISRMEELMVKNTINECLDDIEAEKKELQEFAASHPDNLKGISRRERQINLELNAIKELQDLYLETPVFKTC